jgi:hypothetical protein
MRLPELPVPHVVLVIGSVLLFSAYVFATVLRKFAEGLDSAKRAQGSWRELIGQTDRRSGNDRRVSQHSFEGWDRRSGHDRRQLVAA